MAAPQYSTAWGKALLQELGYPVTTYNLAFLAAWANREGTAARYNPLATTYDYPGSVRRPGNTAGVRDYKSLLDGVKATARTLLNGRYGDLLMALKSGTPSLSTHYKGLQTWSGHPGYDNLAGVPSTVSGGGAGAAGAAPAPSKNPKQDAADYAAQVGYSLAVINSDPQLRTLFAQGEAANWSTDRFAAAVKGTNWYRRQSTAQREWYVLSREDPATAAARVQQRLGMVETEANQLGVSLSSAMAHKIATSSIVLGYNDQQIRYTIGQAFRYNPAKEQYGLAGTAQDAIRKAAADYAIPVSDHTMSQWETNIIENGRTPDDFTEYAKTLAKATYGEAVGKAIDAGMSVRQFADPYAQIATQNGVAADPNAIDWTDPKWNQVLKPKDVKTGAALGQPLSLDDATRLYRTDTRFGYDTSGVANQSAAQLTTALAQRLGAV